MVRIQIYLHSPPLPSPPLPSPPLPSPPLPSPPLPSPPLPSPPLPSPPLPFPSLLEVIYTVTFLFLSDHLAVVLYEWSLVCVSGQWGWPTVSVSAVFALASGIIATTIESIGDYHACAKVAGAPPPPLHAVNRGRWSHYTCLYLPVTMIIVCNSIY